MKSSFPIFFRSYVNFLVLERTEYLKTLTFFAVHCLLPVF